MHLPLCFFSFYCSGAHRDLHSFPTRRSSDLSREATNAGCAVISKRRLSRPGVRIFPRRRDRLRDYKRFRSEEHTSELQSLRHLVCRLLLEKKKKNKKKSNNNT